MSHRPLRRGNWSVQELERLRALLPRRGVATTATLLRRSPASVQRKAIDLLRVPPRRGDWTASDDSLLRGAWGALDLRLLSVMLGRPAGEVRRRAQELRQRLRTGAWSRADQLSLKELYGTRGDDDLEVCLSRPREEILAMALRLCLAKDKRFAAQAGADRAAVPAGGRRMPRWTAEQVEQLRRLYADRDNLAVARALGRTVTSVANKANLLGLRKSPLLLTDIGRLNVRSRYGHDLGAAEA
jgi:hypothetical protein